MDLHRQLGARGGGGRGIIQPIRAVLTSKKNTVPQSQKV